MGAPPSGPADEQGQAREDDAAAVLAGTQVIGSLIAESISQVEREVTMPQLRVLMLAATQAPVNLLTVAADLGVHPSNATRTCDRLVRAGLLDRRTSTRDRRHLAMSLTPAGRRLVDRVLGYRRRHVERLLETMSAEDRAALVRSLAALARAAEADTGP
jgi:DNA-binding MarR family transcriptional regulator